MVEVCSVAGCSILKQRVFWVGSDAMVDTMWGSKLNIMICVWLEEGS